MALTPQEQRQLLIDLVSGRITKAEYDEVNYNQRVRDLRTASGQAPNPLTETEKRLFSRATKTTQPTLPTVNDQGVVDVSDIDTTTRSQGIVDRFGTPPQDTTPTTTDSMGEQEAAAFEKALEVGGTAAVPPVQPRRETAPSTPTTTSMKYNLLGQLGPEGQTNPDAPQGGAYVYDTPPGQGDNLGLDASGQPILPPDDDGNGGGNGGNGGTTSTSTGFADSMIWEYEGKNYVVFQIPGTMMFMRYAASDTDLDMLYSARQRPDVTQASDEMWTSSVFFGNVDELDEKVITTGDSPFVGFVDNFEKATLGRPWLKDDDEMFALWVEGYVEDRDILEEEWANTEWWNNSTAEERSWLVLSKGRGIGDADFPADAKTLLDQNRIAYLQQMKAAGIANADTIRDANGNTLANWFADQVTFGNFDSVKAAEQIQALSDTTSGIAVDESITNWLEGKGEVDQTRTGYASARSLAKKWLGPVYGALDDATLADYAGIIRNAENPDVGADILQEKLKAQRKVLFSSDIYDENLTYDDIAAPWQNYSFQFLGERIDETSENWLNVLLANDQNTAVQELTAYGLNNNIEKVIDTMTDNIASSVGVSESGVQRGFST